VFGGEITEATGAAATGATGAGAAGTAVAAAAQLIVTLVVPLAAPEVTVTVAVPPWLWGAVRTARTPLPLSVVVVGEMVPRLVARLTVAPGVLVVAVTKDELPQLRLVGAAETFIVPAAAPVPRQLKFTKALPVTPPAETVMVTVEVVAVTGAV